MRTAISGSASDAATECPPDRSTFSLHEGIPVIDLIGDDEIEELVRKEGPVPELPRIPQGFAGLRETELLEQDTCHVASKMQVSVDIPRRQPPECADLSGGLVDSTEDEAGDESEAEALLRVFQGRLVPGLGDEATGARTDDDDDGDDGDDDHDIDVDDGGGRKTDEPQLENDMMAITVTTGDSPAASHGLYLPSRAPCFSPKAGFGRPACTDVEMLCNDAGSLDEDDHAQADGNGVLDQRASDCDTNSMYVDSRSGTDCESSGSSWPQSSPMTSPASSLYGPGFSMSSLDPKRPQAQQLPAVLHTSKTNSGNAASGKSKTKGRDRRSTQRRRISKKMQQRHWQPSKLHRAPSATRARTARASSSSGSSPAISKRYTPQEDELICQLKDEGLNWSTIFQLFDQEFPGRKQGSIQVRYSKHIKRKYTLPSGHRLGARLYSR